MTQLPEITFLDEARTESELKNQFFGNIVGVLSETFGGAPVSKLFITSGAVVPTGAVHMLDTEGGAVSDDLDTIDVANHPEGRILMLSCADSSRAVTIKHGAGGSGQVVLHDWQDLTLVDTRDRIFLQRVGTSWEELFRAGPSYVGEPADGTIAKTGHSQTWTAPQAMASTPLTIASGSTTWDMGVTLAAELILSENVTSLVLSNHIGTTPYTLIVRQDSTGGRTFNLSGICWPGGAAPEITTAPESVDILTLLSDGSNLYGVSVQNFS